jgi:uncharacterized membrane protein
MIAIGAYFFPFGYAETFYWAQNHMFSGSYEATTWFYYAWTIAIIIIGLLILKLKYNRDAKKSLRRYA